MTSENPILTRMQQLQQRVNQPLQCPDCGSTYFIECNFHQYSKDLYSSGPGGDISPLTVAPQSIRVCLCGRPIEQNVSGMRGRTLSGELAVFQTSLQSALKFRGATVEQVKALAENMASVQELQKLSTEVEEQQKLLQSLTATVEALRVELGATDVAKPADKPQAQSQKKSGKAQPQTTPESNG